MNRSLVSRTGLAISALSGGLLLLLSACDFDSVVGGTCNDGYTESRGRCVSRASTVTPKGGSNPISSRPGGTSSAQTADPDPTGDPPLDDGGDGDGDGAAGDGGDGGSSDGGSSDGGSSDGGFAGGGDASDGAAADATTDPPPLVCAAPLVACRGACISVESDPKNCGACGRICPSNICSGGVCQGATPGDIVLIGHDMADAWNGSVQAKVLSNAVAIPTTDPIRVLSYEAGEDADVVAITRQLLRLGIPRTVVFTTASDDALDDTNLYAKYDVVLVHGANVPTPEILGQRWSAPLGTFTKKGGVFVALDSGGSDMPALVRGTNLVNVGGHVLYPDGTQFFVTSASDVVGAKLLSPYAGFGASVGFDPLEAPSADMTWVVRTADLANLPSVVHKIAR